MPRKQGEAAFQRHKKKEEPPAEKKSPQTPSAQAEGPRLRLVPSGNDAVKPTAGAPRLLPSVALAFVQIFQMLKQSQGQFTRWLGHHAYQVTLRRQRRVGRLSKGTMLDRKAE